MKQIYFRLLLPLLFFCVQGLSSVLAAQSCALPAPGWLVATEITSSRISIEWEPVPGAQWYQITRFDVTNGVLLPTVYTNETEFDSEPHDPGTTIDFEVRATACDKYDTYGSPVNGSYTTTIIVVDETVMHAPGAPAPVIPVALGDTVSFTFAGAPVGAQEAEMVRLAVTAPDPNGGRINAEVVLFSCGDLPSNPRVRVDYWDENNWSSGITYTEIYAGGGVEGPISEIHFKSNDVPFFKLINPAYSIGGSRHIQMQYQFTGNGRYGYTTGNVINPCGSGGSGSKPGGPVKTHLESSEASDRNAPVQQATAWSAAPNPFNDRITVQWSLSQETPVQLLLTDMTGRTVKSAQLPVLPAGEHTAFLQTDNLPTGIYLLSLRTDSGTQTTKLVKH